MEKTVSASRRRAISGNFLRDGNLAEEHTLSEENERTYSLERNSIRVRTMIPVPPLGE
jgi:hypothetical protein